MDESNIGVWLWAVLFGIINVSWVGMDLWLHFNGHETLSAEFREGLKNEAWQAGLAFLTFGSVAAFVVHMFFAP
jgi:hypothetical protein